MKRYYTLPDYRAVVIGAGNIGALLEADPLRPKPATHAGAFSLHKSIQLVGLVDNSEKTLNVAGRLFPGVMRYTDAALCIKREKPNIVSIATPAATHDEYIRLCAKHGVRLVICEKPLSNSLQDAYAIERFVRSTKMKVLLNHQRRFFPLFKNARARIQAGVLGKIQQINAYYSNGILNNGTHIVDALRFLLKDEVEWVSGHMNTHNCLCPAGDCNIDGVVSFKRGTLVSLRSFNQNVYAMHEIHIFGEKGALAIRRYGFEFIWTPVRPSRIFVGMRELDYDHSIRSYREIGMLKGVVDHAVACLSKGVKARSTIQDGIQTSRILFAIMQSAKDGGCKIYLA